MTAKVSFTSQGWHNISVQVHGDAGVTDVTPLAAMYSWHRAMRLYGPDEVHLPSIAKAELGRAPVLPPGPASQ